VLRGTETSTASAAQARRRKPLAREPWPPCGSIPSAARVAAGILPAAGIGRRRGASSRQPHEADICDRQNRAGQHPCRVVADVAGLRSPQDSAEAASCTPDSVGEAVDHLHIAHAPKKLPRSIDHRFHYGGVVKLVDEILVV